MPTENQELAQNTMIDVGAALAGNVPYVGWAMSMGLQSLKTTEPQVKWEDVEKYVAKEIDTKQLHHDVETLQLAVNGMFTYMEAYSSHKDDDLAAADRWDDLKVMKGKAETINWFALGPDGYPSASPPQDGPGQGIWSRAPWAATEAVGEMLAVNFIIVREMITLVSQDGFPQAQERKNYIQNYIDDTLVAYVQAANTLTPKAYADRTSAWRTITDSFTTKSESHGSHGNVYTYADAKLKWEDPANEPAQTYHNEHVKVEGGSKKRAERAWNEARVDQLAHMNRLHVSAADAIRTNLVGCLEELIPMSRGVHDSETRLRKKTGTLFGGISCSVYAYNSADHQASVPRMIYSTSGTSLAPVMQFLTESDDSMSSSVYGVTSMPTGSIYAVMPSVRANFGHWKKGMFSSKWSSESQQLTWDSDAAHSAKGLSVRVEGFSNNKGKYPWNTMVITWHPPAAPKPLAAAI